MMNYKLTAVRTVLPMIMVALFSYTANSQAITKAASIAYTNGVPIHTPSSAGSEVAINTVNKDFYFWNGSAWVNNTGSGAFVRTTSPTLVTPILGTPTSVTLTNATGLPLSTGVTGTLPVANGGTGTTTPSIVAGTNVTVTGTWPNQTIAASGGGTPGGSTTQVQYNNAGTFSGITGATTDGTILTLTTPVLGAATATSINKVTLTAPATGSTLTIADNKTLTANNTLTFTGTDASSVAFGAGGTVAYQDQVNTFTKNQIFQLPDLTGSSATNGINITQTWNTSGAPNLIYGNVTNTASNAASNLLNLQVGGNSLFRVRQNGLVTIGYNSVAPNIFASDLALGNPNTNGTTLTFFGNQSNINSSTVGIFNFTGGNFAGTSGTQQLVNVGHIFGAAAGSANYRPIFLNYTLNNPGAQTGTATGIFLNATETALNGMTHNLMDLQTGGTSRFRVSNIGAITNSATSIVSTPAQQFTGAWFTGGTSTTTKPHVLIEASGATSTNWSTAGTGLGINAASGFTGNLLDLQVNGLSRFAVTNTGATAVGGNLTGSNIIMTSNIEAGGSGYFGFNNRTILNSVQNGILQMRIYASLSDLNPGFDRLQFGGSTVNNPALQTASSNAQTGLAATFVNGSSTITTATNTYAVNQVVQFTTTGTLPTGFAINTNYFIVGTPTATTIEVSATSGGSAITAGSAGSGTHTVVRQNTCTFTNGSSTVTTASAHTLRVGDAIRFSNVGGSLPPSTSPVQDYYILSTTSTTFTISSFFSGTAFTPSESSIAVSFSGTPNITTNANTLVAGAIVRFTTTGTLPTGLATGTDYYVIATSLSTTNIQVSATLNGTAISYTGTGSGTHAVVRQAGGSQILGNGIHFFTRLPGIYVRNADNTANADLHTRTININAPAGYGGNVIDLRVGTSAVFAVSNTGNINTNGYIIAGASITAGANQYLGWGSNKSLMSSSVDGQILLSNNAVTDFNRLQLGGTTSSFPAIKRNGTTTEFRLADDSGYSGIRASQVISNNLVLSNTDAIFNNASTNARINVYTGGIGIETNGSTANNASALLQVNSVTQGFLPPRMTTTQKNAIATPATGLIVFDTTLAKLCVYNGSAWETITSI
jgi:hypothetical protein